MRPEIKENIKLAGSITLKSMGKWALIVSLGSFMTLLTFLIAFFWNIDIAFGEDDKFSAYFFGLLNENIPALILVFGSPIFGIGYILFANKVSIQNIIYLFFKSKAGDYLVSVLVRALEKITQNKGWHSDLINKAILKAKVLHEVQQDPNTSGLQKRVIKYGFKKISMEDVDFQDPELNLPIELSEKFRNYFAELTRPSLFPFWIVLLIQFVLLIVSLFMR
ncbi:MAG: hypothetical protein P8P74_06050 [Crocinitomicaceae bacterium]|nr:hypothetical protein [Crocinitomicaceae bacterium]